MKFRISNCGLIGLAVFLAMCWCIWGEGCLVTCGLSPDGVSYLRMAEAAAQGYLFNPNGVSGHSGWFAIWPLGYPWSIALVIKITSLDAFTAARVLATLISGGILLLFARCARPAFPVLALSLLNLSFCGIFRLAYSEQPYIFVLMLLCFVLSRKDGNRKSVVLAIAGLSVAAFLFRYVGVFAVCWAMAAVYLAAKLQRRNPSMVRAVAYASTAVFVFAGGYLMLNYFMCGSFTGGHPPGMAESFWSLAGRMLIAMLNETQALVFAVCWMTALFFVAGSGMTGGGTARTEQADGEGCPDGTVFILFGLLCNGTVVTLRFLMPFDTLGLRLLCPGTTLIVLGLLLKLRYRLGVDWTEAINAVPMRRILILLVLAAIPASHFQSMENEIRRIMHLPVEPLHDSYSKIRVHVMERYADVPSGRRFEFPTKYNGVYYWINFLRPDIVADVPDSPDKGF